MPDNFQQSTNGPSRPNNETPSSGSLGTKAHETTERLKNTALERVGEVREKADAQKDQIVDRVRKVSSVVREAGQKLQGDEEFLGRYAGVAADGIERAADYLRTADPRRAVHDVETFARRKPAMFFGGAFLLGLIAGRFLKSSQHRDEEERDIYQGHGIDVGRFGTSSSSSDPQKG